MNSTRTRTARTMIAAVACTMVLLVGASCSSSDDSASSDSDDATTQVDADAGSAKSGDTATSDGDVPGEWPAELELPDGFTPSDTDVDDTTGRIEVSGVAPAAAPEVFAAWQKTVEKAGCERTKGNFDDATGEDENNELWEDSACDGYSVIVRVHQDGDSTSFNGIYNKD